MGFKDLEELVIESPHGIRSVFVDRSTVEVSDVEISGHHLAASNLSPVHLSHFVFETVKELADRACHFSFFDGNFFY